jgi:predicted nucleotidyltransferase
MQTKDRGSNKENTKIRNDRDLLYIYYNKIYELNYSSLGLKEAKKNKIDVLKEKAILTDKEEENIQEEVKEDIIYELTEKKLYNRFYRY